MDLIIVESPTKARTLGRFLGSGYQIEASMGHVRDLPENKLGVDEKKDFTPEYVVSAKKTETVRKLQEAAKKAGTIILATDPDREGEAIAWHVARLLSEGIGKLGKSDSLKIRESDKSERQSRSEFSGNFQRITFHEITESAIKEALSKPGEINMQLVDAQQARRILDRLVGYKLSPLLWRKVRKGLSAGRVQSVAVRLIVEREREVLVFRPEEYWEIVAQLQETSSLEAVRGFEAKLVKIDGKVVEISNKEEADRIVAELEKAEYKVSSVETKEVRRYPYPPFTTSTLSQAASNLFGWTAKRTMQVAQNLYEQGLITYHRTDSTNLAVEAVNRIRGYIGSEYGEKYLPEAPRFFKTKSKVAQEAHEAIRPTAVSNEQGTVNNLDRDQNKLFELIWKRFVASQMNDAVYEQTSVEIAAGIGNKESGNSQKYTFRASGSKQIFDGWQRLNEQSEKNDILPALVVNDLLELLGLSPTQHFTEPPARYTEASLIKTLEEYGIGRPSTYAPIISTIQERQYVEKADKKFQPTNLGFAVNDFLVTNFPQVFDYQFTAKMEDELDEIANGQKQWVPVIREFYDPFSELLTKVGDTAERVKVEVETSDEICPNDGAPLVVRIGRFGRFLACSKFPACKFTKPFQKKIDMKCPKCGTGDVIIRRTRSKKTFYGCSNYPKCDFASWTKPKQAVSS